MSEQLSPVPLRLRSYLAPNMFYLYESIASRFAHILQTDTNFDQSPCDALDDPDLRNGQIDIAFICELPLVRLQNDGVHLSAFSAPILEDSRSNGRPVYFADVIVQSDRSQYQHLKDLEGASFCYNDIGSNSGHHLLRHHLMQEGYNAPFFNRTMASDSHQQSILFVLDGVIDCAAIDSAVLAEARRKDSTLAIRLCIVESVGPCPIPPIAMTNPNLQQWIPIFQQALTKPDPTLQRIMNQAGIHAVVPVSNMDYMPTLDLFLRAERANYRIIDV
ncbi:unnamed protein product [Rotaria sp. Silwood2]|nr:unnamed protein product [Rotaria sp. Silwood2]CAF2932515.1 unnamed protein product [Rotaria sp. Silwood2]CAF2937005.1 unnamed protein product [Rotaria sp. Silwood2]CAF3995726.1 unnamed protein product [Rotaria sp. Silwood2]CAF4114045.1 unnamed protein product [Rotaria sp. Silwood2]